MTEAEKYWLRTRTEKFNFDSSAFIGEVDINSNRKDEGNV